MPDVACVHIDCFVFQQYSNEGSVISEQKNFYKKRRDLSRLKKTILKIKLLFIGYYINNYGPVIKTFFRKVIIKRCMTKVFAITNGLEGYIPLT